MRVESVTAISALATEGFGRFEVWVEPTADVAAVLTDVEEAVRCVESDLPANARLLVELLDDGDCETEVR